ncbi:MAG: BrnT family toxin [Syntrophorhabdaceae bacterium]|nr:BrnT family toxin [Syntrophorhabdaceae bacterium]
MNGVTFEWDPGKAMSNLRKHNVSFDEASTVFGDPLAITFHDPDHSLDENRCVTFGLSEHNRLIVVAHAERGRRTRIISARPMNRKEREIYEEG